jgi:queuine/archaeosine tRNA-ribosyltransferase
MLSPESSVQAQKMLGADIIIPLDELLGFHVTPERLLFSFERTHRWQRRSLEEHLRDPRGQVGELPCERVRFSLSLSLSLSVCVSLSVCLSD